MLLSDDLLILELQKLSLLLKISNLLAETFLKKINLGLEHLDPLVLLKLLLAVVVDRHALGLEFFLAFLVVSLDLLDLVLEIDVLLLLHLCLVFEPLVLDLNVTFDIRDVLFRFVLGILLIFFKLFEVLAVDALLLLFDVFCALGFHLSKLPE